MDFFLKRNNFTAVLIIKYNRPDKLKMAAVSTRDTDLLLTGARILFITEYDFAFQSAWLMIPQRGSNSLRFLGPRLPTDMELSDIFN